MPLTQAQPDALANIYATSLFELASEEGGHARIEEVLAELDTILEIARTDAAFNEFLASRIVPRDARGASLRRILENNASGLTLRFLLVLNEKDRLGHLVPIVAAFDRLAQEAFGRVEVNVYTPGPVSPDELNQIKDRLRAVLGKEPVLHPYTDPAMIGGLRLQIGDRLVDASLAGRLRKMRDRLGSSGLATLRSRATRLFEDAGGNHVANN